MTSYTILEKQGLDTKVWGTIEFDGTFAEACKCFFNDSERFNFRACTLDGNKLTELDND